MRWLLPACATLNLIHLCLKDALQFGKHEWIVLLVNLMID